MRPPAFASSLARGVCTLASACAPLLAQGAGPAGLDTMVRSFIARHHIPSVAIAVVKDGRIVKSAGYGIANLELRIPATDSTVYEIGSISKQFAAEALMLLVEDGKLGLDDPLSKYLRVPATWSGITLHHIAEHTSGLKDWDGGPDFSYHHPYTAAEYIELVNRYPLNFAPGSRFAYTSAGTPLLGLVIDTVAREPYERFVERRIFGRAGLPATRFKHPSDIVPNRSGGYIDSAGVLVNGEPLRPSIIAPSGGVMSTARDMARWIIALESGRIVTPPTLAAMESPLTLNDGTTFSAGLGWFLDTFHGTRLLLHNGSTVAGYSSVVYRYPALKLSVVVLMNIDRSNAVNLLATRIASFYGTPLWTGAFAERTDPEPDVSRSVLSMLAAVADGRDSDLLAPNLRNPPGPPRTNRDFGFKGSVDRFALLDREDLGEAGQVRFGNLIRIVRRYKLVSGPSVIYFTVEFTPSGRVARFIREES
jgi:CubicO group peptidase (beta-lactamase class C family)